MKSLIVKTILVVIVAVGIYCQFFSSNNDELKINQTLNTRNAALQESLHYN